MRSSERTAFVLKNSGFSLMLLVPALGPIGYSADTPWLSPFAIFVAVPLLDLILGDDKTAFGNRDQRNDFWSSYLYMVPILYVAAWIASLFWAAWLVSTHSVHNAELIGVLVATGLSSAFATCAAHELLHRRNSFDRWLSRITMAICCYGHFVIEHLHHHRTVGIAEAGTLPYKGESLYGFVLRNLRFSFGNAYRIEEIRRNTKNLSLWSNRVIQQHAISVLVGAAFFLAWGWAGVGVFVFQALMAMSVVETIQYFEHYGLQRADKDPVSLRDSWNCNGWLTNAITLNITRHSHHHTNITVPYHHLNMLPGAPTMPVGYFGLTWLAILPPLWRKVIDRRIPDCN